LTLKVIKGTKLFLKSILYNFEIFSFQNQTTRILTVKWY